MKYDKNGNITHLTRGGHLKEMPDWDKDDDFGTMDQLDYQYFDGSNRLRSVTDGILKNDTSGKGEFMDGNKDGDDYVYDPNGNMTQDLNKGIKGATLAEKGIEYNHLNLPAKVSIDDGWANKGTISYIYDATGVKLRKNVLKQGETTPTATDYAGNYIYENDKLQFFSHAEGTVSPKNVDDYSAGFDYVYNYLDHLGNIRLSYTDANDDGDITTNEIVKESNYYPFGLAHKGYNNNVSPLGNSAAKKYMFGGKELDESLNLDTYDFGARNYDPTIGRWMNLDPLAEQMRRHSPYNYAFDNPIYFIDPDGMAPDDFYDQDGNWLGASDKNYVVADATDVATIEENTAAGRETTLSELSGNVEEIPNQTVRNKMGDAITRSNSPTTAGDNPNADFVPDTVGGFHEEGGVVGTDADGNQVVHEAYPGSAANPDEGSTASIQTRNSATYDNGYFIIDIEYHVHPSGVSSSGSYFGQPPSSIGTDGGTQITLGDLPNSEGSNITNILLSAGAADRGGQKVYYYRDGKRTASLPLQTFLTIPDPE